MNDDKIKVLTDETTLKELYDMKLLSARAANVLIRAGYTTIGSFKNITEQEVRDCRFAGRHTVAEIMKFTAEYNRSHSSGLSDRLISADKLIEYCRKCAETSQELADKILNNVGKGESPESALGGCAYFLQQARMYRNEIPNVIESFIKLSEEKDEITKALEESGLYE